MALKNRVSKKRPEMVSAVVRRIFDKIPERFDKHGRFAVCGGRLSRGVINELLSKADNERRAAMRGERNYTLIKRLDGSVVDEAPMLHLVGKKPSAPKEIGRIKVSVPNVVKVEKSFEPIVTGKTIKQRTVLFIDDRGIAKLGLEPRPVFQVNDLTRTLRGKTKFFRQRTFDVDGILLTTHIQRG